MYKLVIMVGPLEDWATFEVSWADFLHLAESMPGLRREATSRVDTALYGSVAFSLVHELFFDSLEDARLAMASPAGRAAGKLLQEMTQGKVILYLADHKEDDIENLLKYKASPEGKTEGTQGAAQA